MKPSVITAIDELRSQFGKDVSAADDGAGGAYFTIPAVDVGPHLEPATTWIGGHIVEAYPYADIYPLFIDASVRRKDGQPFAAPISVGHSWQNRPALQISRANRNVQVAPQTARSKVLKVIDFLEHLP
jgi:hypothetical protein